MLDWLKINTERDERQVPSAEPLSDLTWALSGAPQYYDACLAPVYEVKYKNILFPDKYSEAAPPLPESDNKMKSLSNKRQGGAPSLKNIHHSRWSQCSSNISRVLQRQGETDPKLYSKFQPISR